DQKCDAGLGIARKQPLQQGLAEKTGRAGEQDVAAGQVALLLVSRSLHSHLLRERCGRRQRRTAPGTDQPPGRWTPTLPDVLPVPGSRKTVIYEAIATAALAARRAG